MGINPGGKEAEYRDILCSALPVGLLFILRRVCTVVFVLGRIYTVMLMIDEVEPGVSVSDEPSRVNCARTNIGKASADTNRE